MNLSQLCYDVIIIIFILKYIEWFILNLINKNSLTLALTSASDCTNISVCHILSYLFLSSKLFISPLGFT